MQKQIPIPTEQVDSPTSFKPTSTTTQSDLIDQINALTTKVRYWTCAVDLDCKTRGQRCLCATGEEPSIPGGGPAGASRSNPIGVSTRREDWYSPVECDANGVPLS